MSGFSVPAVSSSAFAWRTSAALSGRAWLTMLVASETLRAWRIPITNHAQATSAMSKEIARMGCARMHESSRIMGTQLPEAQTGYRA